MPSLVPRPAMITSEVASNGGGGRSGRWVLTVAVRVAEELVTLTLVGRVVTSSRATLATAVADAVDDTVRVVELHLGRVTGYDDLGLSCLQTIIRLVRAAGIVVVMADAPPELLNPSAIS